MTIAAMGAFLALPVRPVIFGEKGILSQLSGMLEILPGFYIASLAAIATFNRQDMDQYLPTPTPQVGVKVRGHRQVIKLTRRRMLSLQFGYLTAISFTIFLLAFAANVISPSAKAISPESLKHMQADFFLGLFTFAFAHLLTVTAFGLYQLSDRIHQPD